MTKKPLTDEQREAHRAYMRAWVRRDYAKDPEKYKERSKAARAKDPDKVREYNREYARRKREEDPTAHRRYRETYPKRYLVHHAYMRARKLSVPFDLAESDIDVPEVCPVLGIKLQWNDGQKASRNASSPSLDRVIPELGYVRGNVVVISNRANHLKNNATPDELRRVAEYAAREDSRVRALFGR